MSQDFPAVVECIYDAAVDPRCWGVALRYIAVYVGGTGATLIVEDAGASARAVDQGCHDDMVWVQRYLDLYARLRSDRLSVVACAKTRGLVLTTQPSTRPDFDKVRFHGEWQRDQHLGRDALAFIDRSPSPVTILAVRFQKPIEASGANDRLASIVPHVSRALSIGQALDCARRETDTFVDVFDRLMSAFVLLDAVGHVVHTNPSARRFLETGVIFKKAQGALRLGDAESNAALDRALHLARDADSAVSPDALCIFFESLCGDKYFANVLPLSGTRSRHGAHHKVVAAVLVRRLGADNPINPLPLARAYRLTPRELTVLITVVESGSVPDAAAILCISECTVKSHLKSIYQKTGTKRQSELAKLAASAGDGFTAATGGAWSAAAN